MSPEDSEDEEEVASSSLTGTVFTPLDTKEVLGPDCWLLTDLDLFEEAEVSSSLLLSLLVPTDWGTVPFLVSPPFDILPLFGDFLLDAVAFEVVLLDGSFDRLVGIVL